MVKRNNFFMCAYIVFIILCVILRIFIDFPLWNSIVLAITTSSILFAFEDLFMSLSQSLSNSVDIAESFIAEAHENVVKDLSFFAKMDEQVKLHEYTENDISELQCGLNPAKIKVQEMNQFINNFEKSTSNKKRTQNRCKKIANIFAFLGFFCLLSTMIITSLTTVPMLLQEIFTVLPFAVILITQQIKNIGAERISNETILSKKALKAQETARNELMNYEGQFDYLINLIDELEQKTEETNHAN